MRASSSNVRLVGVLLVTTLVHMSGPLLASRQPTREAPFLPLLDAYITTYVRLTFADRTALLAGAAVTKLLDAEPSKEVSVFGAVWIDAPPSTYVRLAKKIEHFERGEAFRVTKRISDPPQMGDLALLATPLAGTL